MNNCDCGCGGQPIHLTLAGEVVNADMVQANTSDFWNRHKDFVGRKGVMYIYTDVDNEESRLEGKTASNFKIGDGNSYLIDLPFASPEKAVFCHTTEEWKDKGRQISSKGTFYVYSDARTVNGKEIPDLKVGDGNSYIVDLPFVIGNNTEQIIALSKRVDSLEQDNLELKDTVSSHETKISALTEKTKSLSQRASIMDERVSNLDERTSAMHEKIAEIEKNGTASEDLKSRTAILERTVTRDAERLDTHIDDNDRHVSEADRKNWDSKVTAGVRHGVLILTTGELPEEEEEKEQVEA